MTHPHLARLLDPRSLAVVGPNDKGNVGARTLKNAIDLGFPGALYPVNPNYESIQGLKCYPSLAALPEVPDAVVISVPIKGALAVLAEAERASIPSVVFFSEGFSDAGTEAGMERHRDLLDIAQRSGMAISGPNSMGIFSLRRRYAATFVNFPDGLEAGGISVMSQSGGLINALLELGRNRGLGFNYLISAGNEAVVNAADYLDWLADDPDTKVIVACIEGIKDGKRFRAALERATRTKPVVVLKLGRTQAGRTATLAHTGSLAGADPVFRALCAQSGAVVCETLDALLETAAMFLDVPLPRGENIVLFSTSGGATVLTTDLGDAAGLAFPPLAPATNAAIQRILEVDRPFTNPFDVVGNPRLVKGTNMTQCLETFLADDAVDFIGCVLVMQRDASSGRQKLLDQVKSVMPTATKPIVLIPEMTMHWMEVPPDAGCHVSSTLQDGLVAIRGLMDYAAHRRRLTNGANAHAPAAPLPIARNGRAALTEYESKRILGEAGLPVTREELARSADEAVAIARRIGFPVALKVQSPELMHKSDAGGLMLGLASKAAVRNAYARLMATVGAIRPPPSIDGVLVQEMIAGGVEFLLGMHRDPILGPVVVLSAGGVFVELFENAAEMRLPPYGSDDAEAMVRRSSVAERLLCGFRGHPKADRAALIDLIGDFGRFVERLGDHVAAVDLNPVMVLPEGRGVKIVDAAIEFAKR
jgi:acetate---CoA ligase (ADP-forming)